mgnify:CR=1 FL=1
MIKKLVKIQNIVIALVVIGLSLWIVKHSTYINSGVEVKADTLKVDSVKTDSLEDGKK